MDITIKRAEMKDDKLLVELCESTFRTSWTEPGNENDINQYVRENFTLEIIKHELKDSSVIYFIAEMDGKMTGYTKLTYDLQPDNYFLEKPVALNRLYIKKEFQNHGIGRMLLKKAIEASIEKGYRNLWLGVWNENSGAIRLYESIGWSIFGEYRFIMGSSYSNDYLMNLELE